MMNKVLVIDDDPVLKRNICEFLSRSAFQVTGCLSANDAYNEMYNNRYDLLVSDIMMPGIDGFEFAQTVRKLNREIPILFISAKDDLASKQMGFSIGIDDYMVKPIVLEELLMRIRALLRRAKIEKEQQISIGNLTLDADALTIAIDGRNVPVTTREFNILFKLLTYPNKTFTRTQLLDEFWGYDSDSGLRAVDVYITRLREKLTDCDGFSLVTVRGLGYKAVPK